VAPFDNGITHSGVIQRRTDSVISRPIAEFRGYDRSALEIDAHIEGIGAAGNQFAANGREQAREHDRDRNTDK